MIYVNSKVLITLTIITIKKSMAVRKAIAKKEPISIFSNKLCLTSLMKLVVIMNIMIQQALLI